MSHRPSIPLALLSLCLWTAPAQGALPSLEGFPTLALNRETATGNDSRSGSGPQMLQQGRGFYQAQRYQEAVEAWQQAAREFDRQENRPQQALALSYLSLGYQQLGQMGLAHEVNERIGDLLSANPIASPGRLAQILNIRGHLFLTSGQPQRAFDIWQQASDAYQQADDAEGAIASQINEAQALQALGLYARSRSRLETVASTLEDHPDSLIKALGFQSLGNTFLAIGQLQEAREVLERSLQIAEPLGDEATLASIYVSLGNTISSLVQRAQNTQDLETLARERQAGLQAYQRAASLASSPILQLEAQLNQLTLLGENDRPSEEETSAPSDPQEIARLQTAIAHQLSQIPPSRRSIYARVRFARHLMSAGENSRQVAEVLATAVQQAREIGDRRAESHALGNLGTLYETTQQWPMAETLTREAIVLAQSIDAGDIAYRWHWQLGRLLKAQGQTEAAQDAYQIALTTLQSIRSDLVAMNPEVQYDFRETVEPVYREYVDLLLSDSNPSQKNLQQAREAIEDLQLAELDNFFRDACLDTTPVSVEDIDPNAAILYSIILPDRLTTIVSLPGEPLQFYETAVPQAEIDDKLRNFRSDIGRVSTSLSEVLQQSQQLYDWVIRPLEAVLEDSDVETLTFVLDGLLRNIPIAALHDGEHYLIERYRVALTPGMQLLETGERSRDRLTALAAGLSEARHGFSALIHVPGELQKIADQVNPSRQLLNTGFTRTSLAEEIRNFPSPIIHIATHGQFSSQAENTFILAYDTPVNVRELETLLRQRGEDGESEVLELLVLSACETATGDDRATLGLAGVAVRAGARSTLATLWQVDDAATSLFMSVFYQHLGIPGTTKAEALRQAQLSLLAHDDYLLPYFWSAYILVGNWM